MGATLQRLVGAVLLLVATAAATLAGVRACTGPLRALRAEAGALGSWSSVRLDLVLSALAAGALATCVLWLAAVTLAAVVEAVTGLSFAAARAVSPAVVRRAVALCCGVAVGGAGTLGAAAGEPQQDEAAGYAVSTRPVRVTGPAEVAGLLAGLALPDRVPGTGRTALSYRVRAGDSLWLIAQRRLADPRPAEVVAAWRRLYRANRDAVGPDPDLLLPGTVLQLPTSKRKDLP